jgi:hypothetical protein
MGSGLDPRRRPRGHSRPGEGKGPLVARFVQPNPLDTVFLAMDEASRRLNLPGPAIHLHLELSGNVDLNGLTRAWRALCRLYPAAAGRLELSPWTGRPRWRLESTAVDPRCAVQLHLLDSGTEAELHARSEELLGERLDPRAGAPVRWDVFRGLPEGDVVVMRWPHALMDARGGATILEEVQRLYGQAPASDELRSAGDELRDDFDRLIAEVPAWRRPLAALEAWRAARRPRGSPVSLARSVPEGTPARMRYLVRRLSPDQAAAVRQAALRICGFARLADYVRTCAIRAVHRLAPRPLRPDACYTTLGLVDNRARRQSEPVCRNLFSTLPYCIPAALADDRVETARLIEAQTRELLEAEAALARLVGLTMLSSLPFGLLVMLMERGIRGAATPLPVGLGRAPALPLGFMGPLSRPMPTFCGAALTNVYGLRTIVPRTGLALHVNTAQERMNLCAIYYEPHLSPPIVQRLLEELEAALLDVSSAPSYG